MRRFVAWCVVSSLPISEKRRARISGSPDVVSPLIVRDEVGVRDEVKRVSSAVSSAMRKRDRASVMASRPVRWGFSRAGSDGIDILMVMEMVVVEAVVVAV
jgi:hypothetical protein